MPNGTEAAITQAARLNEIGFPEFTAKLITDTFDALVAANIRQTQAYIELVEQVSKTVTTYINDTRDDIGGAEILQFLATALPPAPEEEEEPTKLREGGNLTGAEATALNNAVAVTGLPGENKPFTSGEEGSGVTSISKTQYDAALEAVANRLSANKYTLLKEMVKMGIMRLVVESGVIETRLTMTTYGSTFYEKKSSDYHRSQFKFKSKARTGAFVSLWAKASASTRYTSLNISTTKETNRDITGSRVQIYGSVVINFKTDYQPMTA